MLIKLYKLDASPPARAAMMGCEVFNVPAEMINVNIGKGEHLTPEYLKKNPLHSIPTYEEDDLIINDSHAILIYIADKYGKDDSWYPKDLKRRALVNQKLFFDTAILFPRLRTVTYSVVREGNKVIAPKQLADIEQAYDFTEQFLSKTKYIAGNTMTIADLSVISDITSLTIVVPLDDQKYPKIAAYIKEMESQPFCQNFNAPGAKALEVLFKESLAN